MNNQIDTNIDRAVQLLKDELIVAIPTETVYGLAGNAYSEKAIKSIYSAKGRPVFNPLIVHIQSIKELDKIAINIPESAIKLANHFWPGALTLVLEKQDHISDLVTAGKSTVAVRVPNHQKTLELLGNLDFPLVAPSANKSNHISPTKAIHVQKSLGNNVPYILDGGECQKGLESTIIGFDDKDILLYRLGSISKEEIETFIGKTLKTVSNNKAPESPGMLKKHYSPNTPLVLTSNIAEELKSHPNQKIGLICIGENTFDESATIVKSLSIKKDLEEAASNLYNYMHELDELNLDLIVVEKMPEKGLGKTINDRLKRASER